MTFSDNSFCYLFYGSWQEEKWLPRSYYAVSPGMQIFIFFSLRHIFFWSVRLKKWYMCQTNICWLSRCLFNIWTNDVGVLAKAQINVNLTFMFAFFTPFILILCHFMHLRLLGNFLDCAKFSVKAQPKLRSRLSPLPPLGNFLSCAKFSVKAQPKLRSRLSPLPPLGNFIARANFL
jgi:hypothetical protein